MFLQKMFPHMKAFEGTDGKLYYIICYKDGQTSFHIAECPGTEIINFCECDLTDYKNKLSEFINMEYSISEYENLCNFAWDIVDLLKEKHFYAYFFTSHSLSNILSRPLTQEEFDNNETYMNDIKDTKNILEEVVIIQEIFRDAIKLYNLPSHHASEKLIGFRRQTYWKVYYC